MNRIKQLREEMDLQQKELAGKIGVSQPTISDWESGRKVPSAKSTLTLAKFFGVTVEYLLGEETIRKEETRRMLMQAAIEKAQRDHMEELRFALYDGENDITDEQFEEVKRFAAYVKERDKK